MTGETGPFPSSFDVDDRHVDDDANHDRNKERMKRLIDAVADAGADAVKFQPHNYDELFCTGVCLT